MFINNVSADGNKIDGLGSVFSFKLMSYALSQVYGLKYIDNKLKNIVGNEFLNLSQEDYDQKLNNYLNFDYKNTALSEHEPFDIFFAHPYKPSLSRYQGRINNWKRDLFFSEFRRNINKIRDQKILSELSKSIPSDTNSGFFKDDINIVFHLRTALPEIDLFYQPNRHYFYGSYKDTDRVNNLIRQIEHSEQDKKLNFHIIGLGNEKLFEKICPMFDRNEIFVHSQLDIFQSFSMMIHNDMFIGTQSGLSYIAHLLSPKKTIFPLAHSFGAKPLYSGTILLNKNGLLENFDFTKNLLDVTKI
tara:strand:+ start:301 stop:1206 length:906 start_codon:yes stop_codon:yes gene_type:complete